MISEAEFSKCGKYRYMLRRIWNEDKPAFMFIGLNPSTTNQTTNDKTITKLFKITDANGGGGFYMLNLYTFVSPHPKDLLTAEDAAQGADFWIETVSLMAEQIIFCWGAFKEAQGRAAVVMEKYDNAFCLAQNQDGSPKHPLYCLDSSKFISFDKTLIKKLKMDDNTVMQWGKHKGVALANIPASYFIWLGEQDFIKEPKGDFNKQLKEYIKINQDAFEVELQASKNKGNK